MKICPNESNCGKPNAFSARYCVYCGAVLKGLPCWSMVGGSQGRTSHYPGFDTKQYLKFSMPHDFYPKSTKAISSPQAIMVHDTLWVWGEHQRTLYQVPLNLDETADVSDSILSSEYMGDCVPDFSASPAFDGVCIDYIHDGRFNRISTFDGKLVGKRLENPAFKNTQRAAPIVVEYENPNDRFCPYRYWVTPLKDHILFADIRFAQAEDYHLIAWENEGDDEARSPVVYKDKIYILTKNGRLYCCSANGEFQSTVKSQTELHEMEFLEDYYCFAPMIVNDSLVFETISKDCHQKGKNNWHEIGYFSINLTTGDRRYCNSKEYAKTSYLNSFGHLSGFSDGQFAYYPSRSGSEAHYYKFIPGQIPKAHKLKWKDGTSKPPSFSCINAIIYGHYLIVVDQNMKRLLQWNLTKNSTPEINPIPVKNGSISSSIKIISQPVIFGDILFIVLEDQIVVMDIKRKCQEIL